MQRQGKAYLNRGAVHTWMSDTTTIIDGHERNHSLSSPQNHHDPLHSVVSRLRPRPVDYVGYSKHASFMDIAAGTRHSTGYIATPSTTYFLHVQFQVHVGCGSDFSGWGTSCFSIILFHAWQHSTRCFLSESRGQNESVLVVSRSLRAALSSPGLNQVSRCPFEGDQD